MDTSVLFQMASRGQLLWWKKEISLYRNLLKGQLSFSYKRLSILVSIFKGFEVCSSLIFQIIQIIPFSFTTIMWQWHKSWTWDFTQGLYSDVAVVTSILSTVYANKTVRPNFCAATFKTRLVLFWYIIGIIHWSFERPELLFIFWGKREIELPNIMYPLIRITLRETLWQNSPIPLSIQICSSIPFWVCSTGSFFSSIIIPRDTIFTMRVTHRAEWTVQEWSVSLWLSELCIPALLVIKRPVRVWRVCQGPNEKEGLAWRREEERESAENRSVQSSSARWMFGRWHTC